MLKLNKAIGVFVAAFILVPISAQASQPTYAKSKTINKESYRSISDLFSVSPYGVGGKMYTTNNSVVIQIISRRKAILAPMLDGNSYYVGKFKNYTPPEGGIVSGICKGIGAFKYMSSDGELKIIPEVYFVKLNNDNSNDSNFINKMTTMSKSSEQAMKSLVNLPQSAADRAFNQNK